MENTELFFEATEIETAEQVKEAHDFAVKNNYKYYRAISKNGDYYGWVNGKLVKAVAGKEWFLNHSYVAPQISQEYTDIDKREVSKIGENEKSKTVPFIVKHEYSFKQEYEKAIEDIANLTEENKNLNNIIKDLTESLDKKEKEKEKTLEELEELRKMKSAIKAFAQLLK